MSKDGSRSNSKNTEARTESRQNSKNAPLPGQTDAESESAPSPARATAVDSTVLRGLGTDKEKAQADAVAQKVRTMQGQSVKGVDKSSLTGEAGSLRFRVLLLCADLLNNAKFDAAVGIVIVMNSISIGLEISAGLHVEEQKKLCDAGEAAACGDVEMPTVYGSLEHFFMFVYSFELALRFFTVGVRCLKNGWVLFDFVLVFIGVISTYIVEPIMAEQGSNADLGPIMVLRVFRLLRLARALRLLVAFRTLWMLVRGLLMSGVTMTYTFALIFLILYIFACMGVEVFTKDYAVRESDSAYDGIIREHFTDIPTTMLTLIQFVTLDSVGAIYKPMIERGQNWFIIVYFVCFILMVSISLMNLVTAVLVNGAIEQATSDKEAERIYKAQQLKRMLPKIREMFMELDADGSGFLELDELLNAPQEVREELLKYMKGDDIIELFECIDVDESGQIDVDEFCDGMARLTLSETPVETLRMMRQLQLIRREGDFRELNEKVCHIDDCLDTLMKHLGVDKPKFQRKQTISLANYVPPTENSKGESLRQTLIQRITGPDSPQPLGKEPARPNSPPSPSSLGGPRAPTSFPDPQDREQGE